MEMSGQSHSLAVLRVGKEPLYPLSRKLVIPRTNLKKITSPAGSEVIAGPTCSPFAL
jgi:allophanate hydrolase subunit 1